MQKKLTVLFTFAIFVLVVGQYTDDSYACHGGKKPHVGCGGGGGGGGGPEPATVDMSGGMLTVALPVSVGTDSSKKIGFVNTDLNLLEPHTGIQMQFGVIDCVAHNGAAMEAEEADPDALVPFAEELDKAIVRSGFIQVERDRKKKKGFIIIEYPSNDLGPARIQVGFGGNKADVSEDPPVIVNDIQTNMLRYSGDVFVRQLSGSGAQGDIIVNCGEHDVVVEIIRDLT